MGASLLALAKSIYYIIAIYIYNINVHWNIPSCIFLFTTIYNGGQNNLEHCGKTFQIIVT